MGSPPIVPSGVTVYDEQEYSWKPSDTFANLSQQYYRSDKYGAALQRFNMNHVRVGSQMTRTGTPVAGEKIYIPQARTLDMLYPDAIAAPTSATPAGYSLPNVATPRTSSPPTPVPTAAPMSGPPPRPRF